MPRVLVTDGEQRASLAIVRSLVARGYSVDVASGSGRSLAGVSRHCDRDWSVPHPLADPAEFGAAVSDIAQERSADVLVPVSESSLLALLPIRSRLAGVTVPFPSYERFRSLTDKARVLAAARELGIGTPRQVVVKRAEDAGRVRIADELGFPVVLKPSRSVGGESRSRRKLGVVHVDDPESCLSAFESLPTQAYPLLVQEKIEGAGAGVFLLLAEDGSVLANFAHRRIREKPPSGGVSVCRESVPVDASLLAVSCSLLRTFGWWGVAMVEYKIDRASGAAYLMEVNPRFWGSLQLAVDSGVDFPAMLVDTSLGQEVRPVESYRTGVRTRWWWGEVDHAIASVREASSSGGLPALASTFGGVLKELCTGWGGATRAEVWRADDPAPFLRESVDWLRRL